MEIDDVVLRLVSPIQPVGDSRIDAERLENLKALGELTRALAESIAGIAAKTGGDHMASVALAKKTAVGFIADLREVTDGVTGLAGKTKPATDADERKAP